MPCLAPICHNDKFVSDIKTKCDLFDSYFADQCTPLINTSKLLSALTLHTQLLIESFHFFADHVAEIIKKLNPKKTHRHDMISIHILKLCGDVIWTTWEIFFKNCLEESIFSDE